MEIIFLGNDDLVKAQDYDIYPFLVIENKRTTIVPSVGLKQCLLALTTMSDFSECQNTVYGIMCNGSSFQLIKYVNPDDISISDTIKFMKPGINSNLDEFIKSNSKIVDCLYSIISNFLKINQK